MARQPLAVALPVRSAPALDDWSRLSARGNVFALWFKAARNESSLSDWGNSRPEKDSSRTTTVQPEAAQPPPQDDTKQAVTALQQAVKDLQRQLSAEEGDRKLLADQVGALSARINDLEKARAEIRAPKGRGAH